MNITPYLLIGSLLVGQVARIPVFGSVAMYPHDIVIAFLALSLFFRKKVFHGTFLKPIIVIIAALFLSFMVNALNHPLNESIEAFGYLVRFVLYCSVYLVVKSDKEPLRWARILYGAGIVFAAVGFIQFILYPNLRNISYLGWDPHYYRLFSTFFDPNYAGIFLVLTIIYGFYFWDKKHHWALVLLQGILFFALLLTVSRSSFVSLFSVAFAYALVNRSWKVIAACAIFAIIIVVAPIPERRLTSVFRIDSSVARIVNWKETIVRIQKAPVFGYGYNFLRSIQSETDDQAQSHAAAGVDNSLLFIMVTTGLVGVGAFIYLFYTMVIVIQTLFRVQKTRSFGLMYGLALIAVFTHSMFTNSMFYPQVFISLMVLTGIADTSRSGKKG